MTCLEGCHCSDPEAPCHEDECPRTPPLPPEQKGRRFLRKPSRWDNVTAWAEHLEEMKRA